MAIGWLLLFALFLSMVQRIIFGSRRLSKIEYARYFNAQNCYAGDAIELVERIYNSRILPVPWLRLESRIHSGLRFQSRFNLDVSEGDLFQHHKSLFSLGPHTQVVRRHQVVCDKRGYYSLDSAFMTGGDLLGIETGSRSLQLNAELIVYPKLVSIDDISLPSHSWQGDITVKRWIVEDPFMFSGVREYRYGDPLNHINWKATARSGNLQVHHKDFTADHSLIIYLDFSVSEGFWQSVMNMGKINELKEKGISYAASIAQFALSKGIETGFGCNGSTQDSPGEVVKVPSSSGSVQFTSLQETMAKLRLESVQPFDMFLEDDVLQNVVNTDYLLITPYLSEKTQIQIDRLKSYGNAVEVLWLHPEDQEQVVEKSREGKEVESV
ncbi:MAG TPA: DUF58 domain-containing protein [Bacillales bacterium]|nr:DUF58 domain-containing protein [Bacillales bacterium]